MLYMRGLLPGCGGFGGFLWESQFFPSRRLDEQFQLLSYIFLLFCGAILGPLAEGAGAAHAATGGVSYL